MTESDARPVPSTSTKEHLGQSGMQLLDILKYLVAKIKRERAKSRRRPRKASENQGCRADAAERVGQELQGQERRKGKEGAGNILETAHPHPTGENDINDIIPYSERFSVTQNTCTSRVIVAFPGTRR